MPFQVLSSQGHSGRVPAVVDHKLPIDARVFRTFHSARRFCEFSIVR